MLHFLNKNIQIQIVALVLLLFWSAWNIFSGMVVSAPEGKMFFFQLFVKAWNLNTYVCKSVVLLMVVFATFSVIRNFNENRFIEARTLLPGIFFLTMLNCGHFLDLFTPLHFTIFFLAIIMLFFKSNSSPAQLRNNIFSVGMIIAIATLVDISAFGIALFLIMMIATNSVSPLKNVVILFLGMLISYIYVISGVFLLYGYFDTSTPHLFAESWRNVTLFEPVKTFSSLRIIDYVLLVYIVAYVAILIFRGKNYFENKLIILRQAFGNLHLQLISMVLFVTLGGVALMPALVSLLFPISDYVAISVVPKRRRFIFDALFIILCVLLWL